MSDEPTLAQIELRQRGGWQFQLAGLLPDTRAPLALAGFLAIPVFFASLMATSLALEKPRSTAVVRHGHLVQYFHVGSASNEAKIWLFAFVAPLLLVVAGAVASHFRFGIYIVCVAAVIDALALTIRLGTWERHHTARFPYGEDLIQDSQPGSLTNRGQWEHDAAQTVHSLVRYAIGLALAAALIAALLHLRRRRTPSAPVGSELQQTGGAPTVSTG